MSSNRKSTPFEGRAYVSTQEAADYLSIDPQTIRRLIKSGEIPARRIGRNFRVPVSALVEEPAAA